MRLRRLDKNSLNEIGNRKIIIYTMVKSYLKQMADEFGTEILDRIDHIVDDVPRNFGICEADSTHRYEVVGTENLMTVSPEEYALVITSEYYWKKFENIENTDFAKKDSVFYFEDIDTAYYHEYLEKYQSESLRDMIVFRSGMRVAKDYPYSDFADNAKALFDYILENRFNEKYELIWLVGDPTGYDDYKDIKNVTFLDDEWSHAEDEENRAKYYRAICLAKYFFFTDHCRFIRFPREGQTRIQLWHGHGFKARNLNEDCSFQYEYMPVAGKLYKDIHIKLFQLREEQVIVTGIPKQDEVFHPVSKEIWKQFNIPEGRKCIFWLPTLRSTGHGNIIDNDTIHSDTGLPLARTEKELQDLNEILKKNEITLVIKIHPEQEDIPATRMTLSNVKCITNEALSKKRLNINRILGYADALISDYSSVAMDYTLLDRPMGFAIEDIKEYEDDRGFVFKPVEEWMPGRKMFTYDDLIEFIEDISIGRDQFSEKRQKICALMNEFQDDKACERIVIFLGIKA